MLPFDAVSAAGYDLPGEVEDALTIETYGEVLPHVRHEWHLANGLGGYASGTVAGVNTRRYHAGLVAATSPPLGRVVALSRWAMTLFLDDQPHELSGAYFRGKLKGDGPRHLRRFQLADEVVTWEYDVAGTTVRAELFVAWHKDAAAFSVHVEPGSGVADVAVELQPMVALRGFHDLLHADEADLHVDPAEHGAVVRRSGMNLHLAGEDTEFEAAPDWWYAQTYPMEAARGLDDREDLFCPGTFRFEASNEPRSRTFWAVFGGNQREVPDLDEERRRRRQSLRRLDAPTPTQRRLARSAADFIVRRRRPDGMPGTTVLSGYPWSGDWGRDTFIALPGLLLSTGRHDVAGQVLSTFAQYVSDGMIPSRFDRDPPEPMYDAVDASLWFIDAADAYLRASRDRDTYDAVLRPACEAIVEGMTAGTRHGIGVDAADGLVTAGTDGEGPPLTWMDSVQDGRPITPRAGKAVEINALWYNALCLLGEDDRAAEVAASFTSAFADGRGGLADVVTGGPGAYERDRSVRPNQIFAVSLRHSPLPPDRQAAVVDEVRRELLTPLGLRTLARGEPGYCERLTGPPHERHRAAHNGTVWPWLIGPFLRAYLKVETHPNARERARLWLRPLLDHLSRNGCVGAVSELFDAEHPHRPGGCYAKAWSTSELLRSATELEL
jgi:predicted glycogen debranching enzyme